MRRAFYDITQCALYKVQSKSRLSRLLYISVKALVALSRAPKYREFTLEEEVCAFTGKKTKARGVQAPWEALRPVHDRILELLQRVHPPEYAHAAVKGRSYRTNAEAHRTAEQVATFDIKSFYTSTRERSILRFFKEDLKCAPDIAVLLAKLLCFPRSGDVGCLPTGSPVSPILSIYANLPLFNALNEFAIQHGLKFTCYVDDLTFSGRELPVNLTNKVSSLVRQYGHRLADAKTRKFSENDAKHVTGVVIHKGKITVPHFRFKKARLVEAAFFQETEFPRKIKLMQKLSGILGEASYLDNRYRPWAQHCYQYLSSSSTVRAITYTTSAAPLGLANPVAPRQLSGLGSAAADADPPF